MGLFSWVLVVVLAIVLADTVYKYITTIRKGEEPNLRIFEFFEEVDGKLSSGRLFAFFVVFGVMIDWMKAVFTSNSGIWTPEWQTIAMVLGVLGFKLAQKIKE